MTSQVAVFNQRGVAVASDTVTTLTSAGGMKTMNNAEKIWTLGPDHLVVVAMSGNLSINSVNSRVLIAEWGRTLTEPLPTTSDYASSFATWFANDQRVVPTNSDWGVMRRSMDDHLLYVYQRIEREIRQGELSESEISDLFHEYVLEGVEHLRALDLYPGASDAADEQLIQEYDLDLEEFLQSEFGEIPGFEKVKALLYESAVLATSRCQEMPNDTTLAFIGFGSEEHLSNLVRTECRGRYGGIPRMRIDPPFGASTDPHSGSISTFAQAEAIMGFVRGVQPDVLGLFFEHWMDGVEGLYEDREEGRRVANELADEMNERITKDLNARFIDPMLYTVGSLSLRDSADLAAALVGIQAMRANASPQPPGVGGLVESLIIDRADGVRWVQRLPR